MEPVFMRIDTSSTLRNVAAGLERGRWDGTVARALASAWAPIAARGLVRPGRVPAGIDVVCVGGATLGGSGKTRVALACALELAGAGARVVVVGPGFRAAAGRARVVMPTDALAAVGDEALVCARALARRDRASVVVAKERQDAIDLAAALAPDVIILDGPLRLDDVAGRTLSLLAVDTERPWGSGELPPAGDLRAPKAALLACADDVVYVDAAPSVIRWASGEEAPAASLAGKKARLFSAIARPYRLADALRRLGVVLTEVVSVPDHGPPGARARSRLSCSNPDLPWLATEKCAMHLAEIDAGTVRDCLGVFPSAATLSPGVRGRLTSRHVHSSAYVGCAERWKDG
jgi:tetraacyldisaccharide 4'-kinase